LWPLLHGLQDLNLHDDAARSPLGSPQAAAVMGRMHRCAYGLRTEAGRATDPCRARSAITAPCTTQCVVR
jgi:hypothetical protein